MKSPVLNTPLLQKHRLQKCMLWCHEGGSHWGMVGEKRNTQECVAEGKVTRRTTILDVS